MTGATPSDLSQSGANVRLGWGLPGLRALAPGADAVVVVDVLSFSTACAVAAEAGASIVPWDPTTSPPPATPTRWVAGPRGKARWSLSPASLRDLPPGQEIVLPSPNGSRLVAWARAHGLRVRTGCIRDCNRVAHELADAGVVAVIAAGERWPAGGEVRFALEDWLGAGAVVHHLGRSRSPEAAAACAAWRAAEPRIEETLRATASGRELVRQGFEEDVQLAAGPAGGPLW